MNNFKMKGSEFYGTKVMCHSDREKTNSPLDAHCTSPAKKRGLWDNIHAKRKRGEAPAKPGDKDYPTEKAIRDSQ
jgi:hypothetical protein